MLSMIKYLCGEYGILEGKVLERGALCHCGREDGRRGREEGKGDERMDKKGDRESN